MEQVDIVDRIWKEIRNMKGYDLSWEWMEEGGSDSEFLSRKEILDLIDNLKKEM